MVREMYIEIVPQVKAMTTDKRMAETIPNARDELIKVPSDEKPIAGSLEILKIETAMAEPSKQKINDTVVEVGRPSEL